jgi:hypothetical protein
VSIHQRLCWWVQLSTNNGWVKQKDKIMNKRTEFMLLLVPVKMRARLGAIRILDWIGNKGEYWIVSAIDRINIDKCHRYDNAVTFREFLNDDDMFSFDEEDYD